MALRDSWIEKREGDAAAANGNRNMSQMHLARQGVAVIATHQPLALAAGTMRSLEL